jgi:hypothetical protein
MELNAGGVSLIFGADGTDYFKLKGDDYAELQIPPKTYHFFVRSNQADRAFALEKALIPAITNALGLTPIQTIF